jgi:hypothetical protein
MRAIAFSKLKDQAAGAAIALHQELASGPVDQVWAFGNHNGALPFSLELHELFAEMEVLWVTPKLDSTRSGEKLNLQRVAEVEPTSLATLQSSVINYAPNGISLVDSLHISYKDGRPEVDRRLARLGTEISTTVAISSFYDEPFVGVVKDGRVSLEAWHPERSIDSSRRAESNIRVMNLGALRLRSNGSSCINYAVIDVAQSGFTIKRREIQAR